MNDDILQVEGEQRKLSYFYLDEWQYFREGSDHLLLLNIEKKSIDYEKVMILQKKLHENPIQNKLNAMYEDLLQKHSVSKFILQKKKFIVRKQLEKWTSFISEKTNHKYHDNHPYFYFYLTSNLFTPQWSAIIQFKPKTPLPDFYSVDTIQVVGKELGMEVEKVKKIIEGSSQVEKTRWYKKSMGKKVKNENPLKIYGLLEGPVDYLGTKLYKQVNENLKNQQSKINQIIHKLIQSQNILDLILSLQCLYTDCFSFVDYDVLQTQEFDHSLSFEPTVPPLNRKKVRQMIGSAKCIRERKEEAREAKDKWLEIYKFLISLSWRDVSLIIRLKLNEEMVIENSDMWVIDYDLKPMRKVKENIEKDKDLLKSFLLNNA